MHRHAIAISLALSTALLPALRGSCPPGNSEDPGSHVHAAGESHQHADGSAAAHSHIDLRTETESAGSDTDSGPSCCQAATPLLGAISSSPNSPDPKRLTAQTLPGRFLNTQGTQLQRDPRSLVRQERASPFVRTRAPLLI